MKADVLGSIKVNFLFQFMLSLSLHTSLFLKANRAMQVAMAAVKKAMICSMLYGGSGEEASDDAVADNAAGSSRAEGRS